jgi:hypothetical protein
MVFENSSAVAQAGARLGMRRGQARRVHPDFALHVCISFIMKESTILKFLVSGSLQFSIYRRKDF